MSALSGHIDLGGINICIEGMKEPVYRPHRNELEAKGQKHDKFHDIEFCTIPSMDGEVAAVGWFLHHGYKGAIPSPLMRGLRLRTGNIQVGSHDLLQDLFTETRFNSWTVGEVYTVDNRIMPNGRRDHFEQNIHFSNLVNYLAPFARSISTKCRQSSVIRNLEREFQRRENIANEKLLAIKQGSLSLANRKRFVSAIEDQLNDMRRIAARDTLSPELKKTLQSKLRTVEKALARVRNYDQSAKALDQLPTNKRRTYQDIFALIYECSVN